MGETPRECILEVLLILGLHMLLYACIFSFYLMNFIKSFYKVYQNCSFTTTNTTNTTRYVFSLLSDGQHLHCTPGVNSLYSLVSGCSWQHYLSRKVLIGLQQRGEVRKPMGRVCGMKPFIPKDVSTHPTNHLFLG